MDIELRERIGIGVGSGKPVKLASDLILLDGKPIGLLHYKPTAKVFLTVPMGEYDRQQIELGHLVGDVFLVVQGADGNDAAIHDLGQPRVRFFE